MLMLGQISLKTLVIQPIKFSIKIFHRNVAIPTISNTFDHIINLVIKEPVLLLSTVLLYRDLGVI